MKKLFLIAALCGATRVFAAPAAQAAAPASDPFADCDKYIKKLAKSNLKPKNQVELQKIMAALKLRRDELQKKLVLGILSNREQLELAKILTYDINL